MYDVKRRERREMTHCVGSLRLDGIDDSLVLRWSLTILLGVLDVGGYVDLARLLRVSSDECETTRAICIGALHSLVVGAAGLEQQRCALLGGGGGGGEAEARRHAGLERGSVERCGTTLRAWTR